MYLKSKHRKITNDYNPKKAGSATLDTSALGVEKQKLVHHLVLKLDNDSKEGNCETKYIETETEKTDDVSQWMLSGDEGWISYSRW